eukprot:CAMPEP_0183720672 /NCGR_PEP_ID=MMETSP0737-20130205/13215_1 /TAXON_ID=385413 /ORGANISM="Thalassiosira miniscula, Strain CCMP1093" /LENGTH=226 /DNA_ID=CAMNT_0025950567 /DNA_START=21 /DNA_END=701 /DNA_ORIENTATION=+
MKLFLLFTLLASGNSSSGVVAHSHDDDSHRIATSAASLLRGGSLPDFLSRKNRCADRPDPMNCIDCLGPSGIGTRWTHAEACEHNAASGYGVPYTCEKGQKFCCTESNIQETSFGNPNKYGTCAPTGSTDDGADTPSNRPCAEDGVEVSMDLYKDEDSCEQDDISKLKNACCSGKVGNEMCISSVALREDGGTSCSGPCGGTCGADETEVVWKVMYETLAFEEEKA